MGHPQILSARAAWGVDIHPVSTHAGDH